METVSLLATDPTLAAELAAVLPPDMKIADAVTENDCLAVFFDIDSVKPGEIKRLGHRHFIVAITKHRQTGPVMEATALGAYEVLHRPLERGAVQSLLEEMRALRAETGDAMPLSHLPPAPTCAIVGGSPEVMDVCKRLARLSQVDAPVLITGETGTGKELIAETIAQMSSRFGKPFVVVNCAAMPEALLESELFGFEKGSFTGATAPKEGLFKIADEGCAFLDEIGELPLPIQAKLLRFLQTQTFYPIGGTRETHVNVRVLSATHRNLEQMARAGTFREDLFHRLRVTTIHIPPLRERKGDILPLVLFFLNRYRHTAPLEIAGFSRKFLERLESHGWPGNIRELENTLRSALALAKTPYLSTHELGGLSRHAALSENDGNAELLAPHVIALAKRLLAGGEADIHGKLHREVDAALIAAVMSHVGENQSEAARLLGISRLTLRKKLRR
ncbi:MAG: sigma-54-dependent Fis family transcriptional regulator [Nitrospirae bacterium]|nr:sigma-54-dependent Fis family transcriptional regulator [Nitrospirota bacterium]